MTYDQSALTESIDPAVLPRSGCTSAALFEQVAREPRLSDKVAEMMLETILSNRLEVGDRLPSERELGEQFGVSRTVVREAVRALVAKGVIDVRSGSGLRVAAVDAAQVSESMSLYVRGEPTSISSRCTRCERCSRCRSRVSQPNAAPTRRSHSFASRRTDAAAIRRRRSGGAHDLEFHRRIALATHNELYLVLMDSIGASLIDIRRANLGSGSTPETLAQHQAILDAIAGHDAPAARAAMADHLEGVAMWWREHLARA